MSHRDYEGEPLVAIYKLKRRCPICGEPDWCGMNSKLVVCMRTMSDKPRSDGEGWIHYLDDNLSLEMADLIPKLKLEKQDKAPFEVCERVYRDFLRLLPLYNHHIEDLKKRGLTDAQVRRLNYRSLPLKGRHKVCKELIRLGHNLTGVPGFMVKDGPYGEYWTFAGSPGYLVPVIQNQRLLGFQIRLDTPRQDGGKYVWFSTSYRKGGAGSGSPFHVAEPPEVNAHIEYTITEGVVKADVAAQHLKAQIIGTTGIGNHRGLIKYLAARKAKEVLLAPDMDIKDNPNVLMHTVKLYGKLVKAGIYSYMTAWDAEKGKGIDDYVVNTGKEPIIFPASKVLIRLMTKAINNKEIQKKHSGQIEYFKEVLTMIKPVDFKPTGGNYDNRIYKY